MRSFLSWLGGHSRTRQQPVAGNTAPTDLDAELRGALAQGQFVVHYQPIIALHEGRCTEVEALIRWAHPQRGLVPPGQFVPRAEETGFIEPMTRWLMDQVCVDLKPAFALDPDFRVAINLAAIHFQSCQVVEDLRTTFERHNLSPSRVVVEATERQGVNDPDAVVEVVAGLKALGISVALDDFGTGHNGLIYLDRFDPEHIKIDGTFTSAISETSARPVLDAIIDLSHRMRLGLVAECVETECQEAYLLRRGVRLVQGFRYARPMPADALLDFLRAGPRPVRLPQDPAVEEAADDFLAEPLPQPGH